MIRVLFFARIREQLGTAELELPWSPELATLGDLQAQLLTSGGERWAAALAAENVVRAVNQDVAGLEQPLRDGDEVAFFPPVTGG
jgi:molybdopterin synthase sulfur carrier subunit